MKSIELKEKLKDIEARFDCAMSEFTKQSGYVEGTLDTIVAMMMDSCPEVAMTSDKLMRTFHGIEGICSSGLSKPFKDLIALYEDIKKYLVFKEDVEPEIIEIESDSLEDSIAVLNNQTKRSKNEK